MTRGAFNRRRSTFSLLRGLGCQGACAQGWLGRTGFSEDVRFPPGQHRLHLRNTVAIPVILNLNHHFPLEKRQEEAARHPVKQQGPWVATASPIQFHPKAHQAQPQTSPHACACSRQGPLRGRGASGSRTWTQGLYCGDCKWLDFTTLGKHLQPRRRPVHAEKLAATDS